MKKIFLRLGLGILGIVMLQACQAAPIITPQTRVSLKTQPSAKAAVSPKPIPTVVQSATPTAIPFYEPAGCQRPPDDYTRVTVNGHTLNTRTYVMLQNAAALYGGEIDLAGSAITQGSYSNNGLASFGTHLGGGAVDISVIRPNSYHVLYTEIAPLLRAMRVAGFAAWLRDWDELGPGSGIHIHAIAIGDRELSEAAREQINGQAGYLRGYNGLPVAVGENPQPDRYGEPVLCTWMIEDGYTDLITPNADVEPTQPWQERLRRAAQGYIADNPADAAKVAMRLAFLDGKSESADNICGPLAAAILRDARLLPNQDGPVNDLKSYWLAKPNLNGRPWSLFSPLDYTVYKFTTPLAQFDFASWPLQPADFIYTYAGGSGFEHMFVVTEVDAEGCAYTVTNQYQLDDGMVIQRYLLYNPNEPGVGIIYNEWQDGRLGCTGDGGFEVLRNNALSRDSLLHYSVRAGDTLPELAARYGVAEEILLQANPLLKPTHLQVGQVVDIPISPKEKHDERATSSSFSCAGCMLQ